MKLLGDVIFDAYLADRVQLALQIIDVFFFVGENLFKQRARGVVAGLNGVRMATFRCLTASSSSTRSFSSCAFTFLPTLMGPISVMFGLPGTVSGS